MSTRDIYLSDNNIDFLYRDVCDQVSRKYNYNLNSSSKYKKTFPAMMDKVYQNCDTNISGNLASLNRLTVQKISSYFFDQLSKKKENHLMDRPIKTNTTSEKDMSDRLSELRNQRNDGSKQQLPTVLTSMTVQDLESVKGETNKKYQELLAARGDTIPVPFNNTESTPRELPIKKEPVVKKEKPVNNLNVKKEEIIEKQGDFNILPFTLSDDFTDQSNNVGQPLYINSDQLLETETNININNKYEDLQKIRNIEIQEFLNYQNKKEKEDFTPNKDLIVSDYLGERTGVDHINATRDINFNRGEMYNSLVANRDDSSTKDRVISDKDVQLILQPNNPMHDFLLSQLRNSDREYHDVPYYFVVSSEDRQWENKAENRYNFVVNFRPNGSQAGVGIDTLYKNVVSVEVIKVIFPHDRLGVPFDNRIYLDLQSYPFLIMDIDELDWVFKGSNNTLNDAFALLLFDKAYDSEVLTHDQINNAVVTSDGVRKRFDRQFKRGFMSFCPFLFEKKKYPNTPLASLNKMTISFFRPDGQVISLDQDHLEIDNIVMEDIDDHELKRPTGFPGSTAGKYVKITTKTFFSNRTFRVGDLIKIKHYELKDGVSSSENEKKFIAFINRPQGHIIINLTAEQSDLTASNEGYINEIYISPPGEIDYKTGTLDPTTNYEVDIDPENIKEGGVLINSSMQVHITFKIVTREDKTTKVINPINV
jgi:hypothetical protein